MGAAMIVCVCNNVSDRKIRQAAEDGMTTLADLRKHLDVGTCCGKCHSCAKEVLRECRQAETALSFPMQAMAA